MWKWFSTVSTVIVTVGGEAGPLPRILPTSGRFLHGGRTIDKMAVVKNLGSNVCDTSYVFFCVGYPAFCRVAVPSFWVKNSEKKICLKIGNITKAASILQNKALSDVNHPNKITRIKKKYIVFLLIVYTISLFNLKKISFQA